MNAADQNRNRALPLTQGAGKRRQRRKLGMRLLFLLAASCPPASLRAQMDPFFTAINYPVPQRTLMLMSLSDFQVAQQGNNFFTWMEMAEYGITPRWTAGTMVEGQKIFGLPATYGGLRFNTWFQLFPRDHWLHFTLYGEYEYLNAAALYKMEVSGFGGEDLTEPLALARRTPAHTFEQRAIIYHDWGRLDLTFNFVSETDLQSWENDFGYAWGVFRNPRWTGMATPMGGTRGAISAAVAPPRLSTRRFGYGLEMIGALGNTRQFGFDWHNQQQYLGPAFTYVLSPHWSLRLEPAFGLADPSDPLVLRMGLTYSSGGSMPRLARTF